MKKGKKLTREILSIRSEDEKPGGTVSGFFAGIKQLFKEDNSPVIGNFDQELYTLDLRQKDGEILTYWADGGLRGALKMSKVQLDQPIIIEHTGSKKVSGVGEDKDKSGTLQTYDIFGAE